MQPTAGTAVPEWQSLREAARVSGVSEASLWRCVQAGLVSTPAGVGNDDGGSLLLRTEDLRSLGLLTPSIQAERFALADHPWPGAASRYDEPAGGAADATPPPRPRAARSAEPAWAVRPTAAAARRLRRRSRLRVVGIAAAFFALVAIVDLLLRFIS